MVCAIFARYALDMRERTPIRTWNSRERDILLWEIKSENGGRLLCTTKRKEEETHAQYTWLDKSGIF